MKAKNAYVVAVVGATSLIGKEILEVLEERSFPVARIVPLSGEESAGERVEYQDKNWSVKKIDAGSLEGVDIAFFCGDSDMSRQFAPEAAGIGVVAIDCSNAFTTDDAIPLVIPEVNPDSLKKHGGIIRNPGAVAIGLTAVLKPLQDKAGLTRIVTTTFLSVSGTGKKAVDELAGQTVALLNFRDIEKKTYPHQIAFNCIPHVDSVLENGSTGEEKNTADEIRRLLADQAIGIDVTAVRVPVFRGHAASVNIETKKAISVDEVRAVLAGVPGLIVYDDPKKDLYPVPIDVAGKDEIYVGRIREDESIRNGISLWLAFDNLRKGSALNAIQIAELLVR